MTRAEFSKATKIDAFWAACGNCAICGLKIQGRAEYHHIVPAAVGGSNELDNCSVVCKKCHRHTTSVETVPAVAKSTRILEKRLGVRKVRGFRPAPKNYDTWGRKWKDK